MMTENRVNFMAIIPAYNEAAHIQSIVRDTRPYLPVLVVDDGSADRTADLARETGARVIRQEPNRGKGAALRTGFRAALAYGLEAVITLDADGQHAPADIPAFLQCWDAGHADLIIGARDFNQMPIARRISNTFGRWTFSWAVGQDIPDNQSGYRLLSARMMTALLDSMKSGFEFEGEMIATCIMRGFRLGWVPIRTIYAGERSHIRPWQHTINYLRLVWETRRRVQGQT